MKIKEILIEGLSPSSIRKMLVDFLKQEGLQLSSQESSDGAMKAWMDAPSMPDDEFKKLMTKLAKKHSNFKIRYHAPAHDHDLPVAMGTGFEITLMQNTIFIAVYKKNNAGKEYSMGIDT